MISDLDEVSPDGDEAFQQAIKWVLAMKYSPNTLSVIDKNEITLPVLDRSYETELVSLERQRQEYLSWTPARWRQEYRVAKQRFESWLLQDKEVTQRCHEAWTQLLQRVADWTATFTDDTPLFVLEIAATLAQIVREALQYRCISLEKFDSTPTMLEFQEWTDSQWRNLEDDVRFAQAAVVRAQNTYRTQVQGVLELCESLNWPTPEISDEL